MEIEIKKTYNRSGDLTRTTELLNGVENGLIKWWYDNGQLWGECNKNNGLWNKMYQHWLSNGVRNYFIQMKSGSWHGPKINFHYGN